jgi:hypothetical protein
MYNVKNELMCRRNDNNSNVEYDCPDFSSEEIYVEQNFLSKVDRFEKVTRKVRNVVIFLIIMRLFGLFSLLYTQDVDLAHAFFAIVSCLISISVILAMYSGKSWALIAINITQALFVSTNSFKLFIRNLTYWDFVATILVVLLGIYILYFFNLDKDFKKFYRIQRGY